ncbi:hypothetical protein HQN90_20415 [Paenibacillus alba]|uniref:Gp138 family membrane-puncturing spike protein n=1 Tax=Paenibacillus alba TaxID=1197127 RepID=UPI00156464F9|nr:Gp138 family membrane-puncturing spike protein [Paenibacillus alba]NQX68493.1 hypothetical protein [Paenibacillus alba]
MKNDPAGAIGTLITGAFDMMARSLCVSFVCRVLAYDSSSGMATIQPLVRATENDSAPIQNVPALGHRFTLEGVEHEYRPALRAGDAVLVVCTDHELKNTLTGQITGTSSQRSHDHNDAVIVGVLPCSLQS